jgi:hypothetical protein
MVRSNRKELSAAAGLQLLLQNVPQPKSRGYCRILSQPQIASGSDDLLK